MLKEKRGKKLVCPNCSKKFYDLNREDFDCPMCHERYIVEVEEDEVEEVVPEAEAKTEDKKSDKADELLDDDDDLADLIEDDDDEEDKKEADENDDTTLLTDDEEDNVTDIIDIPSDNDDDS